MHWSLEKRVVVGFALMGVVLAASAGIAYQNTRTLISAGAWVGHTQEVLAALAETEGTLADAQTSVRGYVITGEEAFLAPYRTARDGLTPQIDHLRALTVDNPVQQARSPLLTSQVDLAISFFEQVIATRQEMGFAAAQQLVREGRGDLAVTASRRIVVDMETEENRLLVQRTAAAQASATSTLLAFIALVLLGFALLGTVFLLIRRDRSERRRAEAALQEQRNLYQMLLQAQSDLGVGVVVADGVHILYANDAYSAITGYSLAELGSSASPLELIAAADRPAFTDRARRLALGEDVSGLYEVDMTQKGGQRVPVQGALQRILFEGRPALISVVQDITERKRAERVKSEFVSTVSHELRTPLTSIRGALGLISGGVAGPLPAQAQAMIAIAYNNSERLVRLINDILDIDKLESGRMVLRLEPLPLIPLIEQTLEANQAYAAQYGVCFQLMPPPPAVEVLGDADRLMQVLTNLLSNAAKFSPRGGTVTITVARIGAGVRIAVTDQGPGIPAEFRGRIFEKFAQADASDTRQKGGTGLGLSIAKAIVERHGGEIGFSSARPTTFYFTLPEHAAPARPVPMPDSATRPRILICEDDHDVATLLAMMLAAEGYDSDIAYDGHEARRLVAERAYTAMTLDLLLPDADGTVLIRELRAQAATRALPIIVVSVQAGLRQGDFTGSALSVLDWIDKPIDQARLAAAVRRAAGRMGTGRPRILHVEDDPDIVQIVAALLAPLADLVAAPDLAAARQALATGSFDLVLLDLSLPDGPGLDLLSVLDSRPGPPVPVVVFSAQEIDAAVLRRVATALVKTRTSDQELVHTIRALVESRPAAPAGPGVTRS